MNEILLDLIIVIVVLAVWLALVVALLRGWRNRGRRQADAIGEVPSVPADPGDTLLGPDSGMYLGATFAPSWQNRVAVGDYGDRAAATFRAHPTGIHIERNGATDVWIPRAAITAIRTERGHAGKVMGAAGVLVIRWILPSGTELDTGFRADDKAVYASWIAEFEVPSDTSPPASQPDPAQPDTEQRNGQ
ncbi:transporter [Gordonia sp. DT30]|uniref:PH-like domain-containing protein n=1 Tax=Gordonia sp. DT30 TaxID=3416546 RepID=UPI003CF929A8